MTQAWKQRLAMMASLAALLFLPLAGSLWRFDGLPPGYGDFPPSSTVEMPGFNPTVFWSLAAFGLVVLLLYLFPRLFGFRKVTVEASDGAAPGGEAPGTAASANEAPAAESRPPLAKAPLPAWFWAGGVVFVLCLAIFWGEIPFLDFLDSFMSVPLWWGFVLVLDGLVYHRTGGSSLLARKPKTLLLLALVSSGGWFMFEYLDYFTLGNWYYPNQVFSDYGNIVWFLACYTGIFPQLFEYYHLFMTFPRFSGRYSQGPRLRFGRVFLVVLIVLGLAGTFLMGRFPFQFFPFIWVGPVLVLWGLLGLMKIPTPFDFLAKGDWRPLLLTGLAMVLSGLGWEMVNFGSEFFFGYLPVNPDYWVYSLPYVNDVHLPFSQMPILGYMGYIPYAWMCWLQWNMAGRFLGFDTDLNVRSQV